MPCTYKRKTELKYSLEDLKKAIDDVKTKNSPCVKQQKHIMFQKPLILTI